MKPIFLKRLCLSFCLFLSINAFAYYDFIIDGIYYSKKSWNIYSNVIYEVEVSDPSYHDAADDCTHFVPSYSGSVVIPASITYDSQNIKVTGIGSSAFYGCTGLTSITIPSSVKSIGNWAFRGCSGLTSITIPEGIRYIFDYTFYGCAGLTSVNIPSTVKEIQGYAFNNCSSLTTVNIPSKVTSISKNAFNKCSSLASITVGEGNTVYDSRNNCNAIIETVTNTLIAGCKNTIIPNSVTTIGEYAFDGSGLTSINIPSSVTTIGGCAFYGCNGLTFVIIPNSVTSIGASAFRNCSSLTSVAIPNSMTSIGYYAFGNCSSLAEVYCHAKNIPETDSGAFNNSPIESATLHVPADVLEVYKTTAPWSKFGTIVAIEDDEVTATDVSAMSYAIYAQPAKARKGNQATLSVCMKNTQPITLWQADLTLPSGFSLATDSYGDLMVSISGSRTSTSRHSISTSTLSDGSIRILCSSSNNKTFTGTDGEVATITLNVASNVNDGNYAVKFNNIKLVEANETKHEVDEVVSVMTVKSYTLGDVNDDGSIDGVDLVGIVNYILDRPTSGNIFEAADVNQDGVIDGSDYVREVNAILGKIVLSARRKVQRAEAPEADCAVYANDFEGVAGKQTTLHLNMKNDQPVTLWQADLVLPEGVSIATDDFDDPMVYITGGRTTEARHAIATNTLPDGSIRILCSSSSNKTFTGNDGEVATITLNINKDMESGKYPVALKNILIVEADETRHSCDYEECMLDVTRSTGISSLLTFPEEDGQVYNIAGQRLSKTQKGINIQNGKKILR